MTPYGISDEVQLATLIKILDDCCAEIGITNDQQARKGLGDRIMTLFHSGYTARQIEQQLRQARVRVRLTTLVPGNRAAFAPLPVEQLQSGSLSQKWLRAVRQRLSSLLSALNTSQV